MIAGIGCDLVKINRMERCQSKLADRILSPAELRLYQTIPPHRQLEFLAGRFAAKEALVKACPKKALLSDFEILMNPDGSPCCTLREYAVFLSIAHDGDYAQAIALLTETPQTERPQES